MEFQAVPSPPDALERVLRYIEDRLFEPLDVTGLAELAGLSTFHFIRVFTARVGSSPMAHVRSLRLIAAARRLTEADPPTLVDLAFDCGFDSQEGFTRAFRRAFGVPPGRFRRGAIAHMENVLMPLAAPPNLTMSSGPVAKPALRIAGPVDLFSPETVAGIPQMWLRLTPRLPLPGQASGDTFGVCMAAPDQPEGCMRYMAGAPLTPDAPTPPGFEVVDLPARPYLVFRQEITAGGLHAQMQAATKAIWGELVPRSGYTLARAPDLEYYPPEFRPDQDGWVEWWIPVEA